MRKKPGKAENESRRQFLIKAAGTVAAIALAGCGAKAGRDSAAYKAFFQSRFQEMSKEEIEETLARLEKEYSKKYGKAVKVKATPAAEGVLFGYALDLSRCIGCRRCVYACVKENNQSRDPQIQWIKVLAMDKEKGMDLESADPYYNPAMVPEPGKFYAPVQCQQCRRPPCVKVCPVKATWKEKDGIVVVDYDWCVGCRCCEAACPYGARRFNWKAPHVPADELNPETEYLGNRPRMRGVMEKCTFCLQRSRQGLYPSCVEACPVGARKFGNLLDPESEIRRILVEKRVFVLKSELNTQPQFYYFYGI